MPDQRHRLRIALVGLLLVVAGCAIGGGTLPMAADLSTSQPEVDRLQNGRGVLIRECTACHRSYWPGEYPPAAWRSIVRDMSRRVGLTPKQSADLSLYLESASRFVQEGGKTTGAE